MLGFIEFAINCAVAEGTGQVPADLTIGELLRSPLDVVVQAGSHAGAGDFVEHVQVYWSVLGTTWRRLRSIRSSTTIATIDTRSVQLETGYFCPLGTFTWQL